MAKASTKKNSTKSKSTKPKKAKKIKFVDMPGLAEASAPIDGSQLLDAAKPVLVMLETDLLARAEESPGIARALNERYQQEKAAERTADSFVQWQQRIVTQVAASWLISCVFVRTLEDRGLLGTPRIAGPGAMDSQKLFFELSPSLTERDYLLTVFRELSRFPAAKDLFDPQHSLLWKLSPSANAAKELLALFRTPDAQAPAFRFGQASTRFLGDLYQDLSEEVRKRYALLQTPDFIESFILDRTLEPAIERFGLDDTTLIDPTCGSGHFLLGAFDRLFEHHQRHAPGIDARRAAHKALDQVFGADINPYAVAIARFRLTLAYLDKAGFQKLSDAPELPLHLVVADSLLHNPHQKQLDFEHQENDTSLEDWRRAGDSRTLQMGGTEVFALEDEAAAKDVLHRQYAAVVGNPPYITVKDKALRDQYRAMYPRSAVRKYSLAAPFCERFFQLGRERGYIGQITANSFMKREFGKKLIQDYLPSVNLELIVNTSGAYIPGHGTPTVLLFGTHEAPKSRDVLTVLAKRGEPSTPVDPAKGEVWSSMVERWSELEFENDYISVANTDRNKLAHHPWSLAGGGAPELKELLESRAEQRLGDIVSSIGFMAITGDDDVFARPRDAWLRMGAEADWIWDFGIGEEVRDWGITASLAVAFPYRDAELKGPENYPKIAKLLWPYRSLLLNRPTFGGKKYRDVGRTWYEHHQVPLERLKNPRSITFAFVATHNHFVFDRGGKVFKQTAPVIKLPTDATEDDHLALLAYLNSSTACFYLKQVCMDKGLGGQGGGIKPEEWHRCFEHDGTKVGMVPLVQWERRREPTKFARALLQLTGEQQEDSIDRVLGSGLETLHALQQALFERRVRVRRRLCKMIGLQEELDWWWYEAIELIDDARLSEPEDCQELEPGGRPFENRLSTRSQPTIWFEVHRSQAGTPTEGTLRRLEMISESKLLQFLEDPMFKRRWYEPDFEKAESDAIQSWLQGRLETWIEGLGRPATGRELDKKVAGGVTEAAALGILAKYWNMEREVTLRKLLVDDAVAIAPQSVFSETGLKKFAQWQVCWDQQRAEDREESVAVTLPPKFGSKDFINGRLFSLRGKLNVPKERFISYLGCESDEDGEPVYGWAGWDHIQRAQALAALYQKRKTEEGWTADRLTPMLAGLLELIPWVKQWHNEPSDEFGGLRMGDYFEGFLDGECREHGLSTDDLEAWRPAKKTRGSTKKVAKKSAKTGDMNDA